MTPLALLSLFVQIKIKKSNASGIAARLINLDNMALKKVILKKSMKESSTSLKKYIQIKVIKGKMMPPANPIYMAFNFKFFMSWFDFQDGRSMIPLFVKMFNFSGYDHPELVY